MYKLINSHSMIKYNVNPRGTITGDCQTRAISLALDIPWNKVRQILREHGGEFYNSELNVVNALEDVFKCKKLDVDLSTNSEKGYLTVGEFCDTVGKSGTYLVICDSKGRADRKNHIVCTIDGVLYDTWDSSECRVTDVYVPTESNRTSKPKFDTDIPSRIYDIAEAYESKFKSKLRSYDVISRIATDVPSLRGESISKVTIKFDIDFATIQSFNFVCSIWAKIRIPCINFSVKKPRTFNITFDNADTYESVMKNINSEVDNIVNTYFDTLISQIANAAEVNNNRGNLYKIPRSQNLLAIYKSIPDILKSDIVNMETICGYTAAILNVGVNSPYYIAVIAKSSNKLIECLEVCLSYPENFWRGYSSAHMNILPEGFIYKLYDTYWYITNYDRTYFKQFLDDWCYYIDNVGPITSESDLSGYFENITPQVLS